MIPMKVKGIAIDPQQKSPAVILTDEDEKRFVPIFIGINEAIAIFYKLSDQHMSRPLTHDLLQSLLDSAGAKVAKVVINDVNDGVFYSRVFLGGEKKKEKDVDSRPSDAIALALRTEAPIFVSEKVILEAGIEDKEKAQTEAQQFKSFLENMTASDFVEPDAAGASAPPESPSEAEDKDSPDGKGS